MKLSGIGLLLARITLALVAVGCAGGQVATVTPQSTAGPTQAPVPTPNIQATVSAGIKATTEAMPTATPEPTSTPIPTSEPPPSPTPTPEPLSTQVIIDRLMDPISLGADFAKYAEFLPDCEWERDDYEPWPGENSSAVFPGGAMKSESCPGWRDYVYEIIEANGADLRGIYGPMYAVIHTPGMRALMGDPLPSPLVNEEFQMRAIVLLGAFGFTATQARDTVLESFLDYTVTKANFVPKTKNLYEDTVITTVGEYSTFSRQNVGGFVIGMGGRPWVSDESVSFTVEPASGDNSPSTAATQDKVVIATWKGQATKNTETFHVPTDEWRISWDTKPGEYGDMNFQIYVYKSDGTPHDIFVVANVIGEDIDSSVMRGAGNYYLTINTGQPYEVTVAEVP